MKKIAYGILILAVLIGGYSVNDYFYDDENRVGQEAGYVIETEVDGPWDCTNLEEYDAKSSVCYIECETPEQCDAMEAKLDAALDALDNEFKEFSKGVKAFEGNVSELEEKAEVVYEIKKEEEFVIVLGDENEKHIKVRSWLADISPNKFSDTYLNRLILYTKVGDDTMAYVTPSSHSEKWDMYVNMDSMRDGEKEMVFTLIHEYVHILTLNNTQVAVFTEKESCENYFTQEGCMNENAYLNIFYQKFWEGKFDTQAEDSTENYDKDPSAFVTEYAAVNPGEDIAESFASFVFKKKTDPNTIAEQKVSFFYSYPELIKVRDAVREALGSIVRKRIAQ